MNLFLYFTTQNTHNNNLPTSLLEKHKVGVS